ncbi:MAG: hypothetical protein IPM13_05550 [Phycisphaerales bacterium]|nr:hypothetical protein [Phycisphaerales bacterium]
MSPTRNLCCWLVLLAIGGLSPSLAIHPDWAPPTIVDSVGNVGQFASLALDPVTGRPAISYLAATGLGQLRFAEFNGTNWTISTVATGVGLFDVYTSLVYFPDGRPAIAYYDYQRGRLRYAERNAGVWTIVTVDGNDVPPFANVGAHCSMRILPNGNPAIAYIDRAGTGSLKYAERVGGVWNTTVVAPSGAGGGVSLAVVELDVTDSDRGSFTLAISFVRNAGLTLAYVDGGAWQISANLDTSSIAGDTALACCSWIAYFDDNANATRFARYIGGSPGVPANWSKSVADPADANGFVDLLNLGGTPLVAYHSVAAVDGGLRMARTDGFAPVDWRRVTVDSPATRGLHNSVAAADGKLCVAYFDDAADDLLYTELVNDANGNGIPDELEPPFGACCRPGDCFVGTPTECADVGGIYAGDYVPCEPNPCPAFGACCVEVVSERDTLCLIRSEAQCSDLGGTYRGDDTICDFAACIGACCAVDYYADGGPFFCFHTTPSQCTQSFGTFFGFGSQCGPTTCDNIPIGACCWSGGFCFVLDELFCVSALNGTYLGNGTDCSLSPCSDGPGQAGACCLDGTICNGATESSCAASSGVFLGPGSTCAGNPCLAQGACCRNGVCSVVPELACDFTGGQFQGVDTTCDPNPCPPAELGACCFFDFADGFLVCQETTADECIDVFGGSFKGVGTSCSQNPCAGACCLPDPAESGPCAVVDAFFCLEIIEGFYLGDGTSCTYEPCTRDTGACCFGDSCDLAPAQECVANGGDFLGYGVQCSLLLCQQPRGACCLPDVPAGVEPSRCVQVPEQDCLSVGGTYQGDGSTCATNPCDLPTGACCQSSPPSSTGGSSCSNIDKAGCDTLGGAFKGVGTGCDQSPCVGACCFFDVPRGTFECTVVTPEECFFNFPNSEYLGDGTTCTYGPCGTPGVGACCLGDLCDLATAVDCENAQGVFLGVGTECGLALCRGPSGACCRGTDCDVLTWLACFQVGGTYQGDDSVCDPNPCAPPPTGACCLGPPREGRSGPCYITTEQDCTQAGNLFQGPFTTCPVYCPGDMDCDGDVDFDDIDAFILALQGPFEYNSVYPCCPWHHGDLNDSGFVDFDDIDPFITRIGEICGGQPPTGACCSLNGTCSLVSAADCAAQGGAYQGDETTCGNVTCPTDGACCLGSECFSGADFATCTLLAGGVFLGSGVDCSPTACPAAAGACCIDIEGNACLDNLTQGVCQAFMGVYNGDGSECGASTCGLVDAGACCIAVGGPVAFCIVVEPAECASASGEFLGPSVSCVGLPCSLGACCLPGGECQQVSAFPCFAAGGEFQGVGSSCDPSPCALPPVGACCRSTPAEGQPAGPCFITTEQECILGENFYQGDGTVCPEHCAGDMDCDGDVDFDDIDPFVLALQGPGAYNAAHPCCPWLNGDTSNDGQVTFDDIDAFVDLIGSFCGSK